MRVAVYARVSSETQADRGTIESQLDYLRRYADLNNLDVVAEYPDEAVTGPTALANRPMGKRLLEDARLKKFNRVIFYRVDRFARPLYELLDAERALGTLSVSLQSASEPFDTSTPMGRAIFQIFGTLAELEKSTIAERTELGRRRIAREGRFPGGPVSFGYAVVNGRLVPSTRRVDSLGMTESEVIQDVFQRIADGSSLVAECTRLNQVGVPTAKGGLWHEARLSRLLREPVYLGQYIYHTKGGDITVVVPPLIDPDLRDRALAQLRRNATNRPTGVMHLLRGKIRCTLCGGAFVAQSRGKSGVYYRCARQRGKIDANDADTELDLINAEVSRLHAELTRLETTRSLASAHLKRLHHAEEIIKEVAGLPDTPENRRLAIEALLQKIAVKSDGEGRAKRAKLTFHWLGQDPFTPLNLKDVANVGPNFDIEEVTDDAT